MLHVDTTARNNSFTYTVEQYNQETADRRKNSFLETIIILVLIVIGLLGLYALMNTGGDFTSVLEETTSKLNNLYASKFTTL